MESKTSIIVAAIDFGTTFSGWAFSFKHEFDADPTKVHTKHWTGGGLVSLKAPTTVLIKPDGKTLDCFGYDAENKYAELASNDSSDYKSWYYFRRFKMKLHGKMTFHRNMSLEDETQKSLPAQTVFSLVIRCLKDDLLKINKNEITEDEITWVLTVPAIWNDAAKQFMREAAIQAGIKNKNLKIALEPETASIFCRLLPVEKMVEGGGTACFKPGSKYMVLDAGGGTVDITVHEVIPGDKLKEIHKASGGDWGGIQVDEAFRQFLISLVGAPVFHRFQMESKEDYLDMIRDFEIKKRETAPGKDTKVTFRLPSTLKDIFEQETGEDLRNAIKQTRYADRISLSSDKLRLDDSIMKSFFSSAIQNTVTHVKEILKASEVLGLSSILMVGGFSDSKMLQGAIKSNFPDVKVIVPQEAGLVVLKGAVVFGHSPTTIALRVCKYTYGISTSEPFNAEIHDTGKKIRCDDVDYCKDIFRKYVEIGQTVSLNETVAAPGYHPLLEDQTSMQFGIYASTQKSPKYVTDAGCVKLGSVTVDELDMSVPRKERSAQVSFIFGGTEIDVKAEEERTGKTTRATVNFLG